MLDRPKQVRDYMIQQGHIIPMYDLLQSLRTMGYTEVEIAMGFQLYLHWKG